MIRRRISETTACRELPEDGILEALGGQCQVKGNCTFWGRDLPEPRPGINDLAGVGGGENVTQ